VITRMTRVRFYGPKEHIDRLTAILYQEGVLHIEELPAEVTRRVGARDRVADDRDNVRERLEVETVLDKVRKALLLLLPAPPDTASGQAFTPGDITVREVGETVSEILRTIEPVFARGKELKDRASLLTRYEKMIRALLPLVETVPSTEHLEMIGLTIDRKNEAVLDIIEQELMKITGENFHIFHTVVDENTTAAVIAFGKSFAPWIREILTEKNLNEIRLPSDLGDLPFKEALQAVSLQASALPAQIAQADREIALYAARWHRFLTGARDHLAGRLQQLETSLSFLRTHYSFVIAGWVPKRSLAGMAARLEKEFGGTVIVEEIPVGPGERKAIPVEMRNPPLIRSFEVFVRLLPLPVYGTIDPTILIAFFFPIFYGLIVGDIGYGVISLGIGLWIRSVGIKRASATIRDLGSVLAYSSIFAVAFGIVFGELFGTIGEQLPKPFTLHPFKVAGVKLDRLRDIPLFLGISVAIGVLHVFLGIVLGMVNAVRLGHRKHLIFKIGQFASLGSLCLLVGLMAGAVPKVLLWPLLLVLFAGLVTIIKTEGFAAPIELISAMGNIISYARLMAVGLSGLILALVANELGKMSKNVVVGILIALVIHAINIVLGIFSPTLHSMRLHLVEFFTKFYETGGVPYKPFRKHGGE
jgi:V/A-type H+-transporting ATPase subunit I